MAGSLSEAQVSSRKAPVGAQMVQNRASTRIEPFTFTLEEFFILGVLKGREMYGLQIVRSISAYSDFGLSLGKGVIYPSLKNLVKVGAVSSRHVNGGPQTLVYYTLTNKGLERFKGLAYRLAELGETAKSLAAGNRPLL
jgi:DNA-binding PadR family transcriptional regulator